jgi:hypothetical protein
MARTGNLLKLLATLREQNVKKAPFTVEDIAHITGYSSNSINKYFNEKLIGRYVFKQDNKKWLCQHIDEISDDDFIKLMSQSAKPKELTLEEKTHNKLIDRSLDAFTLALEVYNRPSLKNRVESFAILMVNAWELLLKAEIIRANGIDAIFIKDKSISISDAVKIRLQDKDPVKINLDTLIGLRDQAVHLLIPELQPQLSRLFQANVLNYQARYRNEMGNPPLAGQSVGMLSLVIDGPEPEFAIIKSNYGDVIAAEVSKFLEKFKRNVEELDSNEFSIPIDYRLALVKRKDESDLSLSIGPTGDDVIIIREPKDPEITHPYYTKAAIEKINELQTIKKITNYSFDAVIKKHKVQKEKSTPHHFQIDDRHRYSEKFIKWFVENLKQPNWLDEAIKEKTHQMKKRKKV